MSIIDSKIQKVENGNLNTYHPETNTTQVYDFNSKKWLNELIHEIKELSLTEEQTLLLIKNEIKKHEDKIAEHNQFTNGNTKMQISFGWNSELNCLTADISEVLA